MIILAMNRENATIAYIKSKDGFLVKKRSFFCCLSLVPLSLFACNGIENWIYSTICAIFGLTSIVVAFIISPKKVLNEFKRKYHL